MQRDASKCDQCQKHAPNIHQPSGNLNPITSPWLFPQWGLDIIGPFPQAIGNRKFFLVATNYFTKWAEAKVLANIKDVDVKKFVWKNIVTRFGVPRTLILDNGLQFDNKAFQKHSSNLGIVSRYLSPAYPQSNGQAKAMNKTIVNGLKKRQERAKGNWAEELPSMLWAYRTTLRRSVGETPFSMTYRVEAVIPVEINMSSMKVSSFSPGSNDAQMIENLDFLEERQDMASIWLAD